MDTLVVPTDQIPERTMKRPEFSLQAEENLCMAPNRLWPTDSCLIVEPLNTDFFSKRLIIDRKINHPVVFLITLKDPGMS